MNDVIASLQTTLFHPAYEIGPELLEIELDSILEDGLLKDIPIVRSIAALCKFGYNLHERNLIKQTLAFIKSVNNGLIPPKKLEDYQRSLEENPQKAEKELGRVIIILNSHINSEQSRVLGSFYQAYVKGAISWKKFCELAEANRRIFVADYDVLLSAYKSRGLDITDQELYQIDRLVSLGLLQNVNWIGGSEYTANYKMLYKLKDIIVTAFGETFCQNIDNYLLLV